MRYERVIAGRVVAEDRIIEDGWIAISEGSIAALGRGSLPAAAEIGDYGSAYILPGVVDGQTHAGSQIGFPGLAMTTKAAVSGGVTTIVDMPYDEPDPITNAEILNRKIAAIGEYAVCDVALYGTVTPTPDAGDVAALIKGGVCAFKISSFESHPWRFPRIDNAATLSLAEMLAGSGLPLGLHNEDQDIVRAATARLRAEGKIGPRYHSPSRPEVAELVATANFLEVGAATPTHLHIVHISTPDGFDIVRDYARRGVKATAEMCGHYLYFDAAEDMERLGGLLKVNPPIREGRREALWDIIENGRAAFVSSDHSAWPLSRKNNPRIFDDAAGMPGLDTLLPAFLTAAAKRYGAQRAVLMAADLMSRKPAAFFGLSRKGELAPGMDADVTVLDPSEYQFDSTKTPDGVGWSAYDGEVFSMRPVATYVRGIRAWDGSVVTAPESHGAFVARG